MAPQEQESPSSLLSSKTPPNLKVITLALELPVVQEAVANASMLAGPYVETILKHSSPVLDSIQTRAEISVGQETKDKITSVVETLDTLACSGLASLTDMVPGLKKPELLEDVKDCVIFHCDLVIEYLASFKLSQLGLALANHSLLLIEAGLKTVFGVEQVQSTVIKGLRSVGRGVRTIKRAGARRAGTARTFKTLGEVSLLGALADMIGVNFVLSFLGLQLVPAFKEGKKKVAGAAEVEGSGVKGSKFGDMTLSDYDSDQDVDYVPSKQPSEEGSIEYDSASSVEEIVAEEDAGDQDEENDSEGEELDEEQYAKYVSIGGKLEVENAEEDFGEVADVIQDIVDAGSTDEDGL